MHDGIYGEKLAKQYEANLTLPVVSTIRNQEAARIHTLLDTILHPEDEVLDVGAGTGYYSLDIARRVKTLTALEPSVPMAKILEERAANQHIGNVTVVHQDFMSYEPGRTFDHTVTMGVLDHVQDWRTFLSKCIRLTRRTLLFTAPQRGLLGTIYSTGAALGGMNIHTYSARELRQWFAEQGWAAEIHEAGLHSALTRGMTLVVVARPVPQAARTHSPASAAHQE
jgi:2-polyprenyl-3-methyl-5-hydroxy-6-metoxy-1,4-benzoquinol methylase